MYYYGYYVDTPRMDSPWVGNWEYLYFRTYDDAEIARQDSINNGERVTEIMFA